MEMVYLLYLTETEKKIDGSINITRRRNFHVRILITIFLDYLRINRMERLDYDLNRFCDEIMKQ